MQLVGKQGEGVLTSDMMKRIFIAYLLGSIWITGFSQESTSQVQLVSLEDLKGMIDQDGAGVKVYNFWASWCGPCVKELPLFDKLYKEGREVVLVSLDAPSQIEKAKKVLARMNINSPSYLLDEKDADKYITTINEEWTGAIPATLMVAKDGRQYFYESAFNEQGLRKTIQSISK